MKRFKVMSGSGYWNVYKYGVCICKLPKLKMVYSLPEREWLDANRIWLYRLVDHRLPLEEQVAEQHEIYRLFNR